MTRKEAEALVGPRPKSRTKEYYRWWYRMQRLLHPQKYERKLERKRNA